MACTKRGPATCPTVQFVWQPWDGTFPFLSMHLCAGRRPGSPELHKRLATEAGGTRGGGETHPHHRAPGQLRGIPALPQLQRRHTGVHVHQRPKRGRRGRCRRHKLGKVSHLVLLFEQLGWGPLLDGGSDIPPLLADSRHPAGRRPPPAQGLPAHCCQHATASPTTAGVWTNADQPLRDASNQRHGSTNARTHVL